MEYRLPIGQINPPLDIPEPPSPPEESPNQIPPEAPPQNDPPHIPAPYVDPEIPAPEKLK